MSVAVPGRKLDEAKPVAMRIESHRLGIHRHDRAEIHRIGQVVPMQMEGRAGHELGEAHGPLPTTET